MALWDEPTEINDDTVFGKRLNDKALQKMPDATGGSMTLMNPRYGLLSARNRGGVRPTLPNRDPENDRPGPDDRRLPSDFIADVDEERNRFSPYQPVAPFGPPSIVDAREWDYPTGYNLEIVNRHILLGEMLRGIVRGSGIIANELSARVDELVSLPWKFVLKNPAKGVKSEDDPRIKELNAFFKMPDRKIPYPQWMEMIFRERYTIDAATVYIWKNRAGTKPYALEVIDGNCYSDDTEALTKRGWILFKDAHEDDLFATRNSAHEFEWQKATHFHHVTDYKGRMIHFSSRAVDLLVTENHRMLLNSLPRQLGGSRWRKGEAVVPAGTIASISASGRIGIPMTSVWKGYEVHAKAFVLEGSGDGIKRGERKKGETEEVICQHCGGKFYVHPYRKTSAKFCSVGCRARDNADVSMTGDEYCSFMGMYLAEGCFTNGDQVFITQNPKSKGFKPFRDLLTSIFGKEPYYTGASWAISSKSLYDYLSRFGKALDKFIPEEIKEATPRQLELFWRYYWYGDGSAERERIFTSSRKMADDLSEISQKIGYSASVASNIHPDSVYEGRVISSDNPVYSVTMRKTEAMQFKCQESPYKGDVYCVSVPNEILYVRRNGKPAWCGNTIVPKIDDRGRIPDWPSLAYVQIVKGLPMDNFTEREIVYMPRHRWAQNPIWGYSEVEQILMEATQQVRKTMYMLSFWNEGTCPDVMVCCPENWTAEQIALWQGTFDALMSGNLKLKSKMRFIPGGGKPFEMKGSAGDLLKSEYDEWMARIVCRAFRTDPKPYIKDPQPKANAEEFSQQMRAQGLNGEMLWWSAFMERLIYLGWGWDDIGHVFDTNEETAANDQATIDTSHLADGMRTVNELRARDGLDDVEGGDVPMVKTGTGWMPLAVLAAQTAMPSPVAPGGTSGASGTGKNASKPTPTQKEAGTAADRPLAKRGSHWSRY